MFTQRNEKLAFVSNFSKKMFRLVPVSTIRYQYVPEYYKLQNKVPKNLIYTMFNMLLSKYSYLIFILYTSNSPKQCPKYQKKNNVYLQVKQGPKIIILIPVQIPIMFDKSCAKLNRQHFVKLKLTAAAAISEHQTTLLVLECLRRGPHC